MASTELEATVVRSNLTMIVDEPYALTFAQNDDVPTS